MNKQRLLELAGLGSNMSNPSQEPYSEIPSAAENPIGAGGSAGYDEVGDVDDSEDPMLKIKGLAEKGMENPEEAVASCQEILDLLNGFEETENEAP